MAWETVWTFQTARFIVELGVMPETDDPAGHFDRADDVAFAQEGGWHWFQARVRVAFRDDDNPKRWAEPRRVTLGEDYLGGCSYEDDAQFRRDPYFRSMVREAVREAREKVKRINAAVERCAA